MMIRQNGYASIAGPFNHILIEIRLEATDPEDAEDLAIGAFRYLGPRATNVELRKRQWSSRNDVVAHVKTIHSQPNQILELVKEVVEKLAIRHGLHIEMRNWT